MDDLFIYDENIFSNNLKLFLLKKIDICCDIKPIK